MSDYAQMNTQDLRRFLRALADWGVYPRRDAVARTAGVHAAIPEAWDGTGRAPAGWTKLHQDILKAASTDIRAIAITDEISDAWTANQAGLSAAARSIFGADLAAAAALTGSWVRSSIDSDPTSTGRCCVVYGDSITRGIGAPTPDLQSWTYLASLDYPGLLAVEGYGGRSLLQHDAARISDLAAELVRPSLATTRDVWIAIGTNDYNGQNQYSHTAFATSYGQLLDAIHAADAGATIYCQTIGARTDETANTAGSTLADFNSEITTAAGARGYCVLVDAHASSYSVLQLSDNVHPNTAGHAAHKDFFKAILAY